MATPVIKDLQVPEHKEHQVIPVIPGLRVFQAIPVIKAQQELARKALLDIPAILVEAVIQATKGQQVLELKVLQVILVTPDLRV